MAKDTGHNYRKGEVTDRSQVFNPHSSTWVKRNHDNGQFMGQKENGKPYKGIRKER